MQRGCLDPPEADGGNGGLEAEGRGQRQGLAVRLAGGGGAAGGMGSGEVARVFARAWGCLGASEGRGLGW